MPIKSDYSLYQRVFLRNKDGQLKYLEGKAFIVAKDDHTYTVETVNGDRLTISRTLKRNRNWNVRVYRSYDKYSKHDGNK